MKVPSVGFDFKGKGQLLKIFTERTPPLDSRLDYRQTQTSFGVLEKRNFLEGFHGLFPCQSDDTEHGSERAILVYNTTIVLSRTDGTNVDQVLWTFDHRGKTTSLLFTTSSKSQLQLVPGLKRLLQNLNPQEGLDDVRPIRKDQHK